MYICKTYQGKMRSYLKKITTFELHKQFYNYIDENTIRKVIIKELSNPNKFTLSDLEEIFNNV